MDQATLQAIDTAIKAREFDETQDRLSELEAQVDALKGNHGELGNAGATEPTGS